jgi:hypothetical protein
MKRLLFDSGARFRAQGARKGFVSFLSSVPFASSLKPFEYFSGFGYRNNFVGPGISDTDY